MSGPTRKVVGVVPAAGWATRLSPLPLSKELFPLGFQELDRPADGPPKVACQYLLEKMRDAGITRVFMVLRPGKWDIPAYFENGRRIGMKLAYLVTDLPYGVPFTLDQAFPFLQDELVATGFPDLLFDPADAFSQLLEVQQATAAQLVLGLCPAPAGGQVERVGIDAGGRVRGFADKPEESDLPYSWACAVWTPVFARFMHDYLMELSSDWDPLTFQGPEIRLSRVFQAALHQEMEIAARVLSHHAYLDIGTPEGLREAVRRTNSLQEGRGRGNEVGSTLGIKAGREITLLKGVES